MTLRALSFRSCVLAVSVWLGAGVATAAELPIIAKARARLGTDAALDAVRSIHYFGTLTSTDPADPTKELKQKIEIVLQKPDQQRIFITSDKSIEVVALDGYEAWRRLTDAQDSSKWQQTQLGPDQVKQLRADVWENLAFFRGLERAGGTVEDKGPVMVDGVACQKVAFIHNPGVVYYRYFNRATGDLVKTTTGNEENSIREEGEILAGGIHFPKAIVMKQTANGKTSTRTITFDKITLNETFPSSLFAVPLPIVK